MDGNVHKQSSYRQSCIHPPRQPKTSQASPQVSRRQAQQMLRHRIHRVNSSALGHDYSITDAVANVDDDDENVGGLRSSNPLLSVQGDFVRELDNHFGSGLGHTRREKQRPQQKRGRWKLASYGDSDYGDGEGLDEDLFCDPKPTVLEELEKENYRFRSMSHFYDSIPDYNDLHHLSETEFYARLERLKIQQQELMDLVVGTADTSANTPRIKLDTAAPTLDRCEPVLPRATVNSGMNGRQVDKGRDSERGDVDDTNSLLSMESTERAIATETAGAAVKSSRPTSSMSKTKKSVRISSGTTYRTDTSDVYDEWLEHVSRPANARSKSASPRRSLTIPKPFKMTQREEEEKMLDDMEQSKSYLSKISINFDDHQSPITGRRTKPRPFKANPVPLTSRIPLYEHIREDHRRKSALAKLNSAIELQSQIKPFKFSERPPSRCLSRAASTPNLAGSGAGEDLKPFKATPCPRGLFSNYFYNKLWEDEYFRALNKRIRAEEMLKISNLPPSMAKRAETYFEISSKSLKGRKKKRKGSKRNKNLYDFKDKDSTGGSQVGDASNKRSCSSVVSSSRDTTPTPSGSTYPVNRPNLAATLRVQSARQKVRELSKPKSLVPESRLTGKGTRSSSSASCSRDAWGVKKTPAWRSMSYDPTNMEDIAMRLATRRAEQRLRKEEHEISMELMKQRVRAAPLLLEGPTYWGPNVGKVSHQCRATELGPNSAKSNGSHSQRRRARSNSSKLSFYDAKG